MPNNLQELIKRVNSLAESERKEIEKAAFAATAHMPWVPNPGPQTEAFNSKADELFYGGAAGGGKSSLLCGLSVTSHQESIIFRREYPELKGILNEMARIVGSRVGLNTQDKMWKLPNGRQLEFGAVQHEDDKERFQGRAHSFIGFDEITAFTETQYRFLIGWNRSTIAGERCRVVAAGNPPFRAEGAWVIKYWAPWLDPNHPKPAKPGELRWFTVIDGQDVEVEGPGPYVIDDRPVTARSRTFIPSRLEDNPDLMATGYASVIEGMPEPLRTMMREGRFDLSSADDPMQVIPTKWIMEAQGRWREDGWKEFEMTAMALDPAGGGRDAAEICFRHGGWFGKPVSLVGKDTADGSLIAAEVFKVRKNSCPVVVDVGGGYGGAPMLRLQDNGVTPVRFDGGGATIGKSKDGARLSFYNKRAEAWWRFREALDPNQEGGCCVALPPDSELRADLSAPHWELTPQGIKIELKDKLRERLGRSPGKGDAAVMCLSEGNAAVRRMIQGARSGRNDRPVMANRGFAEVKRHYA